jgi:hypothetical protein
MIQLFRSLLGFAFPLFGQQLFKTLGTGFGNTVRLFFFFFSPFFVLKGDLFLFLIT